MVTRKRKYYSDLPEKLKGDAERMATRCGFTYDDVLYRLFFKHDKTKILAFSETQLKDQEIW